MITGKRNIVLGLGNTLATDEGVGVHVLSLLADELGAIPQVEFLDGGTLGLNLLPVVESAAHLLLLDAVNAGLPPGTIVELRRDEIPLFTGVKMSQHQITFQEVLGLASIRGKLPEHIHLVGVQPADLSIGVGLSGPVKNVLPELVKGAKQVLRRWELLSDN